MALSHRQLPSELLDHIVDFLSEDRETLASCSLANKLLRAASRPRIFQRITVRSDTLLQTFIPGPEDDPTPEDVSELVRSLIINGDSRTVTGSFIRFIQNLANSLAGKLPRLSSLEVRYLSRYQSEGCAPGTFPKLSEFTSIRSVTLIRCSFPLSILLSTLSSFPNLQELRIKDFFPCVSQQGGKLPLLHSPSLTTLGLSWYNWEDEDTYYREEPFEAFLDWILASSSKHTLRSVSLSIEPDECEPLGRFLRELGDTLEHLELDLKVPRQNGHNTDPFDLSHNTNLHTLSMGPMNYAYPTSFILSTLPSNIRHLRFCMNKSRKIPSEYEYENTAKQLKDHQDRLSSLREVCFVNPAKPEMLENVRETVTNVFPNFERRGILRVE